MSTMTNLVSYLDGIYAPVTDEIEAFGLEIIGELPADMDGMFVQNNPNPRFEPPGAYHWFDGDGMVHAVQIRDGAASYRNRYIQTEALAHEAAAGKAVWGGLLMPIDNELPGGPDKNTANTRPHSGDCAGKAVKGYGRAGKDHNNDGDRTPH